MFSWGDWQPWNRLALIGIAIGGTACGDSAGTSAAGDPTMYGELGMSLTSEGSVFLWAGYSRAFDCPGTTVPLGGCAVIRDCTGSPTVETFDAGEVTVAGTLLEYSGSYYGTLSGSVPYGQSIIAEATGTDDVPAHSLSLTVPEPAALVEPSSGEIVIDRTRDLVVRWQGGNRGTVSALLIASGTRVACFATLGAGSITFPNSLLAKLEPTLAESPGNLTVHHTNSVVTRKGEWEFGFHTNLVIGTNVAVVE